MQVLSKPALSKPAQMLWLILYEWADAEGRLFAYASTLAGRARYKVARQLGCDADSLRMVDLLKELHAAGWLRIESKGEGWILHIIEEET